jgi:hypothetical protein
VEKLGREVNVGGSIAVRLGIGNFHIKMPMEERKKKRRKSGRFGRSLIVY